MTDRVLTETEILGYEKGRGSVVMPGVGRVHPPHVVKELCTSHRLQAARMQELEKSRDEWKSIAKDRIPL